ncbi:hypothetical protein WJX73_009283 [Symbiochloris irregularis]|uniref:glutathione transferase n=1 Tax=Symbiochloris irregularis TaxID=706552 RepID=A0AAW1NVD7_9CHLO
MGVVVHHLNNSRSQRILWLLEELKVDYEIKRYQRDEKTMLAPKELEEVHPLGKSPVITDDGVTVAETGAIVEYLVDNELEKRTWFAGEEFSAADIIMSFPIEANHKQGSLKAADYPKLAQYLETIHARPAYKTALEKGGEYNFND